MRIHTNAGFGQKLHSRIAAECQKVGHGIRTAIAVNDEHAMIAELAEDALLYFRESTFIIGGWDWRRGSGLVQERHANLLPMKDHLFRQCDSLIAEWLHNGGDDGDLWIEIGNELDLSYWERHLDEYHELAMHLYNGIRTLSSDVKIIIGSTSNFTFEPFWKYGAGGECFERLCKLSWPADAIQGLHPYGFTLMESQLRQIEGLLKGRKIAITENGFKNFPDHLVAQEHEAHFEAWKKFGAVCYDPYQIQDAPAPHNRGEGGFGLYSNLEDGLVAKSSALTMAELKRRA